MKAILKKDGTAPQGGLSLAIRETESKRSSEQKINRTLSPPQLRGHSCSRHKPARRAPRHPLPPLLFDCRIPFGSVDDVRLSDALLMLTKAPVLQGLSLCCRFDMDATKRSEC